MEDYGVTINFTMVTNGEGVTIGVNYDDSNGIKFSKEYDFNNTEEVLKLIASGELLDSFFVEALKSQETPEKKIERLEAELESSKLDNTILQQRLDEKDYNKSINDLLGFLNFEKATDREVIC